MSYGDHFFKEGDLDTLRYLKGVLYKANRMFRSSPCIQRDGASGPSRSAMVHVPAGCRWQEINDNRTSISVEISRLHGVRGREECEGGGGSSRSSGVLLRSHSIEKE